MEQLLTAAVAFVTTALSCKILIPKLNRRGWVKRLATGRDHSKGIPSMGGIALCFGVLCALLIGFALSAGLSGTAVDGYAVARVFAGFGMALGFGLMGFVEDYIKIVKRRETGLRPIQKCLLQLFIAVAYLFTLKTTGVISTLVEMPFVGTVDFGFFYYLLMLSIILGTVNVVPLVSDVDGLPSSVSFIAALGFCLFTASLALAYAGLPAAALAGGCMGFLCFNFAPARLLPGYSGLHFLGGMTVAMAFACDLPVFLVPVLLVYLIEGLSWLLQYVLRELRGKTPFSDAPLHRVLQKKGWSPTKVVAAASVLTALGVLMTYPAVLRLFA